MKQAFSGLNSKRKEKEMNTISNNSGNKRAGSFDRRIGHTLFKVTVFTGGTDTDTAKEKMHRIIRNDLLTNRSGCAIIRAPQMSRPPEGSPDGKD